MSDVELRRNVEAALKDLDVASAAYEADVCDATGRVLLAAREVASRALAALWDACPSERPATQQVM